MPCQGRVGFGAAHGEATQASSPRRPRSSASSAPPKRARDEQIRRARDEPLDADRPGPRYATIADPQTFFQELGEQAETQIQELAARLAGPDQPGEEYLQKVGRLNMARLQAEEAILTELVLISGPQQESPDADDRVGDADDARDRSDADRRTTRPTGLAFRPRTQDDLAPSGARARVQANLAALRAPAHAAGRRAAGDAPTSSRCSPAGQAGAPSRRSSTRHAREWAPERAQLRSLLDDQRVRRRAAHDDQRALHRPRLRRARSGRRCSDLGFDGGRVLEPGAGAGTFIGMAPDGAEMVGVELDPTTAAIAAALYPDATIRTESFADTPYRAGHFDAAVGNVPFADVRLHDPRHNRGGHSLHNHFIIKSLALTRPGGIVAVLTSRYTLDAQNPAARREMNAMADLVGAVRLPTGAHQRAAGTQVVTDLLILRRREPDREPASTAVGAKPAAGPGRRRRPARQRLLRRAPRPRARHLRRRDRPVRRARAAASRAPPTRASTRTSPAPWTTSPTRARRAGLTMTERAAGDARRRSAPRWRRRPGCGTAT